MSNERKQVTREGWLRRLSVFARILATGLLTCCSPTDDVDDTRVGAVDSRSPSVPTTNAAPTGPASPSAPSASTTAESSASPSVTPPPTEPPGTTGPRRGAFSAHFLASDSCAFSDRWVDVPTVDGSHPVDSNGHTLLLEGNMTTLAVSCGVIESPKLRVLVTFGAYDGVNTLISFAPALSLTEDNPHALRIDVGDDTVRSGDASCSYRALHISDDHTAFLAKFTCPQLVDDNLAGNCAIDEGYFYVENCVPYVE